MMSATAATKAPDPPGRERASTYVLVVALVMSACYAVHVLIDLARPRLMPDEPAIGLLGDLWPTQTKVIFWTMMSVWSIVAAGAVVRLLTRRPITWRTKSAAAVLLLLPYLTYSATLLAKHLVVLLICVPSTAFALWAVYRLQRWRRVPVRLLLAVFGWGVLIASGFGAASNIFVQEYGTSYFQGAGNPLQVVNRVQFFTFISAGVAEEFGKGAAVALVYLIFRRRFDGVVTGLVLGAAVGLGFNLAESVEYMSGFGGASAEFQYFMRQSVGLMAAHTAFSAVVGAGFGVASRLADPRQRRLAIIAGFVGAAGGHFANDVLLAWYGRHTGEWFQVGPTVDILVLQPLALLVLQGPFVLLYVLLLRRGSRDLAGEVAERLRDEAATGQAVRDAEVPILLSSGTRLWLGVTVLRRHGLAAYRALGRLHAAQFDVIAAPPEARDEPRDTVARRRGELGAAIAGAVRQEAMAA